MTTKTKVEDLPLPPHDLHVVSSKDTKVWYDDIGFKLIPCWQWTAFTKKKSTCRQKLIFLEHFLESKFTDWWMSGELSQQIYFAYCLFFEPLCFCCCLLLRADVYDFHCKHHTRPFFDTQTYSRSQPSPQNLKNELLHSRTVDMKF